MLVDMRTAWIGAGALLLTLAGCGDGGGAGRIEPSKLSRTVPAVDPFALINALPEPDELAPGWKLATDTLSDSDYFAEYRISDVARHCKGASPKEAGLTELSKFAVSASARPPQPPGDLWIRVAVDSPGASADRLALIRAAFTKCGELKYHEREQDYAQRYELLRPQPDVVADESFGVRVTTEVTNDAEDDRDVETWAYARSGGLVVVLSGRSGVDAMPMLANAMAEALEATGL